MNDDKDQSLSQLFDKALGLHNDIGESNEDTNSENFQDKVKKGILMLEDATRLVSVLDIFSRNENFKEIQTECLKYFLLPVLLGDLNNKLTENSREEVVENVQIYYIDFLQRCNDYGLANLKTIPKLIPVRDESKKENRAPPRMPDLEKMNAERSVKLARFKESKQLEADLKELKLVLSGATRDEDVLRNYHIKLIRKFINLTLDELSSIEMEIGVLKHMAELKAGKVIPPVEKPVRKIAPIIITKDKFQKEVYGLGYPSLPVLSVDEFYEKRVSEGWWKPPSSGGALQDRANNPELEAKMQDEEERKNDDNEDKDDPEAREKALAWDEYKDDHRRGEGNRHNMG